jgi:hypothetical protein
MIANVAVLGEDPEVPAGQQAGVPHDAGRGRAHPDGAEAGSRPGDPAPRDSPSYPGGQIRAAAQEIFEREILGRG